MLGGAVRNKRVNSEYQANQHQACKIQLRIIGLVPYHTYFCMCVPIFWSLYYLCILLAQKFPSAATLPCSTEKQWTVIPRNHRKLCWESLCKLNCTNPWCKTKFNLSTVFLLSMVDVIAHINVHVKNPKGSSGLQFFFWMSQKLLILS